MRVLFDLLGGFVSEKKNENLMEKEKKSFFFQRCFFLGQREQRATATDEDNTRLI